MVTGTKRRKIEYIYITNLNRYLGTAALIILDKLLKVLLEDVQCENFLVNVAPLRPMDS